jgi:hypothetical protein
VLTVEATDSISGWAAPESRSQETKAMTKEVVIGYLRIGVQLFEVRSGMEVLVFVCVDHRSDVSGFACKEPNR